MQKVSEDLVNVAFVGSREFKFLPLVFQTMKRVGPCRVISGGARGVDRAAESAADALGYPTNIMKADWNKYGKSAGPKRNYEMVQAADVAMVFWDGKSRGTRDFINKAIAKEIPMVVFEHADGPRKIMTTLYKMEDFDAKRQLGLQ